MLATGPNVLEMRPTRSTIKEPGKAVVAVKNSNIAKFDNQQECQIRLKVYAVRPGFCNSEKRPDERKQSHIEEHTRKLKADKKIEHRIASSRSNIARVRRGIPKMSKFSDLRN